MIERILQFAIKQRLLMVFLGIVIASMGIYYFTRLPIDAVPDITNNQVQINTAVTALSPVEIERQITFPIETSMGGIPGVQQVRSLSRYGLSQVTVVFEDGVDIYRARQLVNERLVEAKENLPAGVGAPMMGPISTGLGEIYMWAVEATGPKPDGTQYTLTDLRTIQEWVIKPQLRTVPGVTEVNSIGGFEKQYHVTPDPMHLMSYGLGFRDVLEALAANNSNTGGGYIEHNGEQYTIRATGQIRSMEDIRNIKLGTHDGTPFYVGDVAEVGLGKELRTGAATLSGEETVIGTAIMLIGENSRVVSQRVGKKLEDMNKAMPEGVKVTTLYDRTYLVDATLKTVSKNLFEGAILVIVILFLLLGNIRAAFIVALAIPLSMLFAITGMTYYKVSGNLMSLGAIDFGIIVDGAVVMVENIMRRLAERQHKLGRVLDKAERGMLVQEAAVEVARPTVFGVGIIMIVYLPILSLTGIEGKMFVPMAMVVLLALTGALILTFTLVPALVALLLSGKIAEKENIVLRWAKAAYERALKGALRQKWAVLGVALFFLAATGLLGTRLGSEFVPKLGEGAFAIEGSRIPSISLTGSLEMQGRLERTLMKDFSDEVAMVFSRVGTAEVATDPMGVNSADTYIMLKPRDQWKKAKTQEELAQRIDEVFEKLPGDGGEIQQPIELRFNELIAGVRGDIAVKVYGDDMEIMLAYANKIASILKEVRGGEDIKVEQVTGLPVLEIEIDRAAIARYGLNVKDVQEVISIAMGGEEAGQVLEGDRRFPLVARLPEKLRGNIQAIGNLPIPLPTGEKGDSAKGSGSQSSVQDASFGSSIPAYLPLSDLAKITVGEGPNQVSHENGKRRVVVQCNVRGRDLGGFVSEAQRKIEESIGRLPEGYWLGWGGQFENLLAAKERLTIVVPLALGMIFILLFATFGSLKHALLVFTGVPMALTGGVLFLWLRDIPFSISAGVGFIALSGVAVLNGLVMLTFINQLRQEGKNLKDAVIEGCLARLRPVLMTALVASLGFVPMALATGTGAEVQRPLATVVIGGILSATALTLIVLPILYFVSHKDTPEEA